MADDEAEVTEDVVITEPKIDPENKALHPAVLAIRGNACNVEGCGWIFGDPVHGIEPHPTYVITTKQPKIIGPTPPEPPPRPESAAKCEPVNILDTCGNCGWSAANSAEPHPVRA